MTDADVQADVDVPVDVRRDSTAGCEACSSIRGGDQSLATQPGRTAWARGVWPLLCGALLLAVPKCPLCLVAWLGALGVAGGGVALHGGLRVGLTAAFAVALVGFAVNAWRRRDVRPLLVAMLGAITASISQAVEADGIVLRSSALTLLVIAAVWNTVLVTRTRRSIRHTDTRDPHPVRGINRRRFPRVRRAQG